VWVGVVGPFALVAFLVYAVVLLELRADTMVRRR
jgi:hypothetical protein